MKYYLSSVQQKPMFRVMQGIPVMLTLRSVCCLFFSTQASSPSIQMHIHNSCHVGMGIEKLDLTRRGGVVKSSVCIGRRYKPL